MQFLTKDILIILKQDYAIFYEIAYDKIKNQIFIPFKSQEISKLHNLINQCKNKNVRILLDLGEEDYNLINIPDTGSINLQKQISKLINEQKKSKNIIHPLIIEKPHENFPFWKVIIITVQLNKEVLNFLEHIINNCLKVKGVYLAAVENIYLCKKLKQQLLNYNNIEPDTNLYYVINMHNDSKHIYEIVFYNNSVHHISSHNTSKEKFVTDISSIHNSMKNNIKSISNKKEAICTLNVLPDKLELAISGDSQNRTMSVLNAIIKLKLPKNFIKYTQYSDALTLAHFIKQRSTPINIAAIKKVNFLSLMYKVSYVSILLCTILTVLISNKVQNQYLLHQQTYKSLSNKLKNSNKFYHEERIKQKEKKDALGTNPDIKALYNIVKNKRHPIDVLHIVQLAKGESNILLEKFIYRQAKDSILNTTAIINIDYPVFSFNKNREYFSEVTKFIDSLKSYLPDKEISFYRLAKHLKSKNSYQYIPIEIKIDDNIEYE